MIRRPLSPRPPRPRPAALVLLILLAGIAAAAPAAAQEVSVLAAVDGTTVGSDDRVTYTIEVQGASLNDVETPRPPDTEGLVLVQPTPSTQRNLQIVNGRVSQSVAYRWTFRPIRERGTARIGAAAVTVKGRTYRTDPIALTVVPQSQLARRAPNTPPHGSVAGGGASPAAPEAPAVDPEDLFIRAIPSARTAYQGEGVTIDYRLFFRHGIQLGQSRLADSWDAEGFWREDLDVDTRPIPEVVVENGLRYNTILLKRVEVFPTRAGELTVDPLRIETEVYAPARSRDPFEAFFSSRRGRFTPTEIASSPVRIDVQAPPPGAPVTYRGAAGSFRLDARTDAREVEVGEPVRLEVTLAGRGNLATVEAPTFEAPGVFEQYDPDVALDVDRSGREVRGRKTFTYILVPRSNGTFELPPVVFTYLDGGEGRYVTRTAELPALRVTGQPSAPIAATRDDLPVDDIAGLLTVPAAWTATGGTPLHARPGVYALLVLPLLALLALVLYRRHTTRLAEDTGYARSRRAHPVARQHLQQADALLEAGQARAFYAELERAVLRFIGHRLDVAEQGLTRAELDAHLAAAGVPAGVRAELTGLLDACDRVRFAPAPPDRAAMDAARAQAAGLVATLDVHFNAQPATA